MCYHGTILKPPTPKTWEPNVMQESQLFSHVCHYRVINSFGGQGASFLKKMWQKWPFLPEGKSGFLLFGNISGGAKSLTV